MKCEEVDNLTKRHPALTTASERDAARRHVGSCLPCLYKWKMRQSDNPRIAAAANAINAYDEASRDNDQERVKIKIISVTQNR